MSPRRFMDRPRDLAGMCKALKCSNPIPAGRRRAYCSNECRIDTDVRCGMGIRHYVWARDAGVCAGCGLDTGLLARVLWWLDRKQQELEGRDYSPQAEPPPDWFGPVSYHVARRRRRWSRDVCQAVGLDPDRSLWEADHIIPVAERPASDPPCGLEGFRTLCQPCHLGETRELRQRLAKRQRCPTCGRRRKRPTRLTKRLCMCKEMTG